MIWTAFMLAWQTPPTSERYDVFAVRVGDEVPRIAIITHDTRTNEDREVTWLGEFTSLENASVAANYLRRTANLTAGLYVRYKTCEYIMWFFIGCVTMVALL